MLPPLSLHCAQKKIDTQNFHWLQQGQEFSLGSLNV